MRRESMIIAAKSNQSMRVCVTHNFFNSSSLFCLNMLLFPQKLIDEINGCRFPSQKRFNHKNVSKETYELFKKVANNM